MRPEPFQIPLISVSIVSHGQTALVKRLLQSIEQFEDLERIELIITENIADENIHYQLGSFANALVLENTKPQGFAVNHNQAFKHAGGEYFCVMNPDVVFVERLFSKLIDHVQSGNGDIVAPLVVNSAFEVQDSFRQIPTPIDIIMRRFLSTKSIVLLEESNFIRPGWIAGIILFMHAANFRKLNGFDEKYYLYFEDVDFSSRARLAGLKLLVDPNSKILHDARRQSRINLQYIFHHLRSAMQFFTSPVYQEVKKRTES